MKEVDLKSGDLIQWRGQLGLVLKVAGPRGARRRRRTDNCRLEAQVLLDGCDLWYIPDWQWERTEVVSST